MADYALAYNHVLVNEGGYVNDPDDPGGETYKGVTRKFFPKWEGWTTVDLLKQQSGFPQNLDADNELQESIKRFYEVQFWSKVKGDDITDQDVATSIFDFAVNAGVRTSASLAQMVVGATTDGIISCKTY
jgi:lysozyme family protein